MRLLSQEGRFTQFGRHVVLDETSGTICHSGYHRPQHKWDNEIMATYAIGDIQGCMSALRRLLDHIKFDQAQDRLWFVGDLVNRGSQSLEVLRFVKQLGTAAVTVLGNHDIHLLALWSQITQPSRNDTLQPILSAPDADELLHWLRFRPILHAEDSYTMIHAGMLPSWSMSQAIALAHEVEEALQGENFREMLPAIYFRQAQKYSDHLSTEERLGLTTNVFTRLRVCTHEGVPDFSFKGPPEEAPSGYFPWFQTPNRATQNNTIIFGHWSALGIVQEENIIALDGGCIWGRELVTMRLEDRQLFRVACHNQ
jgi:bis(5'-nucleosyl)-tetraphosphatase (symmetrical)